jgi:hypothetical protein
MTRTVAGRQKRQHARRGALLLLVLITGTIICTISLGALVVQSIHLDQGTQQIDSVRSRWSARSGIAAATHQISGQTTWRSSRTPGVWHNSVALDGTRWTLTASDPTDPGFSDNVSDPVLFQSSSTLGDSIQRAASTCLPENRARQSSLFLACSGDDMSFDSATLEGAGWVGCRDQISLSGTNIIQTDVMSGQAVTSSAFQHRRITSTTIEAVPSFSDFADVTALGTTVTLAQIPNATAANTETVLNGDFGRGDVGWSVQPSCSLETYSSGGVSDSSCAEISNRSSSSCGLVYDVTGILRNGLSTRVSAAVLPEWHSTPFEISLSVTTSGGTTTASWTSSTISPGWSYWNYQTIMTTLTPTWSGRLISATLKIRTNGSGSAGTQPFLVDNVSVRLTSAPSGKAIYRTVLSPATNPFGVTPNSQGIYVLNMGGADLTITDCMMVGTLVVKNAGTVRVGSGPVQWRPAKPGMPTLIVEGDVELICSRVALTERELGANFNPTGTPDENGSQDSSLNDSYRSWLRGLIYASEDLVFSGDVRLHGFALAGEDLTFQQRATLERLPESLTVPRAGTHHSDTFLRETTGVVREFD